MNATLGRERAEVRVRAGNTIRLLVDIVIYRPDVRSLGKHSRLASMMHSVSLHLNTCRARWCACVFLRNALLDPLLPRRCDNSRDSIERLGKLVKSGCDWLHTYARLSNVSRAWIYIFAQCCVFMRHTIRLWPIFSLCVFSIKWSSCLIKIQQKQRDINQRSQADGTS